MQRRHFEAIAEAIRSTRLANPSEEAQPIIDDMVRNMAAVCKRANPNFDIGRFREACEPDTKYRNKSDNRKL